MAARIGGRASKTAELGGLRALGRREFPVRAGLPGFDQRVGTGAPVPSRTSPRIQMAPGVPSGTTSGPAGHGSAIPKKGPTVCEGVRTRLDR